MDSEQWHIPIAERDITLREALESMDSWKLEPDDVPLIIRLIENPKYDIGLFTGSTMLGAHDAIHILLGRGVLPKDEAFVIGFTMGCTKRFNTLRERIFLLITRYLYPDGYKFYKEEQEIFKNAVKAARTMKCKDISKLDFEQYLNYNIETIRQEIGIDTQILLKVYGLEKVTYDSPECQRLI